MKLLNLSHGIVHLSLTGADIKRLSEGLHTAIFNTDLTDEQDTIFGSLSTALDALTIAIDADFDTLHHNPPIQSGNIPHHPQAA